MQWVSAVQLLNCSRKRGAKILIVDRAEEEGLKTVSEIKGSGGDAEFFEADVSNNKNCADAVS